MGSGVIGWGILAALTGFMWSINGVGLGVTFFMLVFLLALILVAFIAYIKVLIIYVKLLTYIIVSPIYFAIGVIPGKENMILDWFKEMAAGVLSVVSMLFLITFSFTVPILLIGSTFQSGQFINGLLTSLFVPVIMIFTLTSSLKMPKKVSGWIKGDQKRR
jgi:hypothetical protein